MTTSFINKPAPHQRFVESIILICIHTSLMSLNDLLFVYKVILFQREIEFLLIQIKDQSNLDAMSLQRHPKASIESEHKLVLSPSKLSGFSEGG